MFGFFFRSPRNQNFSIKVRGPDIVEGETATRSVPHRPLPWQFAILLNTTNTGTSFFQRRIAYSVTLRDIYATFSRTYKMLGTNLSSSVNSRQIDSRKTTSFTHARV